MRPNQYAREAHQRALAILQEFATAGPSEKLRTEAEKVRTWLKDAPRNARDDSTITEVTRLLGEIDEKLAT